MIQTSSLYNSIVAETNYGSESKVEVYDSTGSTLVGTFDNILSLSHSNQLYTSTFSLGSCVSGQIDIEFSNTDSNGNLITIPKMAMLKLYIRIYGDNGTSEWIPQGIFYIANRYEDLEAKTITITGYDSMRKGSSVLYDNSEITWAGQTTRTVATTCANALGVPLENISDLDSYTISAPPVGKTTREVLSDIGTACGGNWTIAYKMSNNTQIQVLRFVPIVPTNTPYALNGSYNQVNIGQLDKVITHVVLVIGYNEDGAEQIVQASVSPDNGKEFKATTSIFTDSTIAQSIVNGLLEKFGSYQYRPCDITQAWSNPALEIGDAFTFIDLNGSTITSVASQISANVDSLYVADITAPSEEEIEDEYPYETTSQKTQRYEAQTGAKLTILQDEIESIVTRTTKTYRQNTAPTQNLFTGDIWYCTDPSDTTHYGKWYRWDGSTWQTCEDPQVFTNKSSIEQHANKIAVVVEGSGTVADPYKPAVASIVAEINDSGSAVMIDADKIQMTGTTTFLTASDVGPAGSTVIDGGRINTNTLVANSIATSKLMVNGQSIGGSGASQQLSNLYSNNIVSNHIGFYDIGSNKGEIYFEQQDNTPIKLNSDGVTYNTNSISWSQIVSGGTAKFG